MSTVQRSFRLKVFGLIHVKAGLDKSVFMKEKQSGSEVVFQTGRNTLSCFPLAQPAVLALKRALVSDSSRSRSS